MSGEKQTSLWQDLLKQHVPTLVIGACIVASQMQSSDAVTAEKLRAIDLRLTEIQGAQAANGALLREYDAGAQCRIRSIQRLADQTNVTLPCDLSR